MSFYLTLPSDASLRIYPDNATSHFKTLLAKPLDLEKDSWEVGLVEIVHPSRWYTIIDGLMALIDEEFTSKMRTTFQNVSYKSNQQLADAITEKCKPFLEATYDDASMKYTLKVITKDAADLSLYVNKEMAELLGFSFEGIHKEGILLHKDSMHARFVDAPRPPKKRGRKGRGNKGSKRRKRSADGTEAIHYVPEGSGSGNVMFTKPDDDDDDDVHYSHRTSCASGKAI